MWGFFARSSLACAIVAGPCAVSACVGATEAQPTTGDDAAGEPPSMDGGASCTGVDLATDRDHCGACGHSCIGGLCNQGICQPIILVADQDGPQEVVVDATRAYFTNFGSQTTLASVASVSIHGGPVATVASN